MPVRLKDIAADLGVSTMTVSKVLRGNADIGPATRARVLARMRELNYQPNLLARALGSGRSLTIGLVVPDLVHPFFAEFARSLGGVLRQNGYALVLASSEEDPEIERAEIRTLVHRGMDAILVASCQPYTMQRPFEPMGDVPLHRVRLAAISAATTWLWDAWQRNICITLVAAGLHTSAERGAAPRSIGCGATVQC
jgi:LacI family transcriptional regulator